jgi:hypothetical protein
MNQASFSFFNPIDQALAVPVARRSDPEPSHSAAREMTSSGRREGQLQGVLALVRKYPLSTSLELASRSQFDRYVIARRLPELERAHLVTKRSVRQCTVGNRPATTWEAL